MEDLIEKNISVLLDGFGTSRMEGNEKGYATTKMVVLFNPSTGEVYACSDRISCEEYDKYPKGVFADITVYTRMVNIDSSEKPSNVLNFRGQNVDVDALRVLAESAALRKSSST